MSHKRKGQLTVSGEWAKHLRPFLRRVFWKTERQAEKALVRVEAPPIESVRANIGTVESLLAEFQGLPLTARSFRLWVPESLTFQGSAVAQDVAMALILDKALGHGLFPDGFVTAPGGRLYNYRSDSPENK